jgi:hypothetical protein
VFSVFLNGMETDGITFFGFNTGASPPFRGNALAAEPKNDYIEGTVTFERVPKL